MIGNKRNMRRLTRGCLGMLKIGFVVHKWMGDVVLLHGSLSYLKLLLTHSLLNQCDTSFSFNLMENESGTEFDPILYIYE